MRGADQQPFASVLEQASERELPESSRSSDPAEDRLDGGLSSGVRLPATLGPEERAHLEPCCGLVLR